MAFAVFGPGSLYITRTDIANATPVNIGFAQEFSLDESAENKELYGQNQYPLVAARGTIKATGKAKAAMVSGVAINSAYIGQSFAPGQLLLAQGEAQTIPAATPFTVTVANAAKFDTDLGVVNANTGLPFVKVASGPTQGQYSVAAGAYTFNTADQGTAVLISYAFASTTGGQTQTIVNQAIGINPTFQLDYATTLNGKSFYLRLFQCIASKLNRNFKLTDFFLPEIDFAIYQNAAGQVYKTSYADLG